MRTTFLLMVFKERRSASLSNMDIERKIKYFIIKQSSSLLISDHMGIQHNILYGKVTHTFFGLRSEAMFSRNIEKKHLNDSRNCYSSGITKY